MHRATEIFDVPDVDVGGNAEDGRQVAEPCIAVRLEIPFPAHGLARFHRQPEPIVRDVPLGFSASEFRHVEARADVTSERTVGIEQRRCIVQDPPVFAVMAAKPIFHHERFTTVEGADVRVQAMLQIGGVDTVCPTIADLGLERSPGEVEPRLVEVGAALVAARNPHEQRQAVRHQPEQSSLPRYDAVPPLIWPPQLIARERQRVTCRACRRPGTPMWVASPRDDDDLLARPECVAREAPQTYPGASSRRRCCFAGYFDGAARASERHRARALRRPARPRRAGGASARSSA